MISFHQGDIFESDAQALVNPVNCAGVMGAGLALEFKKRYPEMFKWYMMCCTIDAFQIGDVGVWNLPPEAAPRKFIINFATKNHWREKSKLEYILQGLHNLKWEIGQHKIESIALPQLGCGLGGLQWKDVRPLLTGFAITIPDVDVQVYLKD